MYLTISKLIFPKPEAITVFVEDVVDPNDPDEHNIAIKVEGKVVMILSKKEADTLVAKLNFALQAEEQKGR